jgi:dTDP-4-dehydrorhamnose 3,5-epimerase
MKIHNLQDTDILILEKELYKDDRGFFYESLKVDELNQFTNIQHKFVQTNVSFSKANVLRGMHWQKEPFTQSKLITVLTGKIFDVCVDIRKSSKNFGKHFSTELNSKKKNIIFIPHGYAHGFYSLEDSLIQYNLTNYYSSEHEEILSWNDNTVNIIWPSSNNIEISNKDNNAKKFKYIEAL